MFVFYTQDQVEVEVVQLVAIRIRAPITRMKTGTQVLFRYHQITHQDYAIILMVGIELCAQQLNDGGRGVEITDRYSPWTIAFVFISFSVDACLCNGSDQ